MSPTQFDSSPDPPGSAPPGPAPPPREKEGAAPCEKAATKEQLLPGDLQSGSDSRNAQFFLRPYQEAVVRGFAEYGRQLAIMPTAAGKTIVFAELAQHTLPGRTLVLAHREELLEQARDKIWQARGIVAEIEAAERVASLDASLVVASVQK